MLFETLKYSILFMKCSKMMSHRTYILHIFNNVFHCKWIVWRLNQYKWQRETQKFVKPSIIMSRRTYMKCSIFMSCFYNNVKNNVSLNVLYSTNVLIVSLDNFSSVTRQSAAAKGGLLLSFRSQRDISPDIRVCSDTTLLHLNHTIMPPTQSLAQFFMLHCLLNL